MRGRIAGGLVGLVFGATLSWTGMSSPVVIRQALLFERSYLFLFFASAVGVAFVGLRLLRAVQDRALISAAPIRWRVARPEKRHIVGSVIFGVGWAIADACPGPVATQLGQGIAWSVFTLAGIVVGITLFLRRQEQPVPSRSADRATAGDAAPASGAA